MNTPGVRITIAMLALLGSAAVAEPEQPPPASLRLALDLSDGSRVVGVPAVNSVPVQTSLAALDVPLNVIRDIKFAEDHRHAVLTLRNGDVVKGELKPEPIQLETLFGKISVDTKHVWSLRPVLGGGMLPAGEGPIAFGGVNWTPWRTLFEERDDKLVSRPVARQGFNYGHAGNGRGATLVTNIGSKDWQDYRIELELGMTGVDPAFNPYGLPPDYRSASIAFHVADAKESWNEKGASGYSLSLNGDGGWNLACSYNAYCTTPCGYGNPTSDGSRTLATGKGLKYNPETGHEIRIDVIGNHIRIWVDGEKIADVQDEKMRDAVGGMTLDHGGVGISWGFESMGWIRNFSVARP